MFNESLRAESYAIANLLRDAGYATEIYPGLPRMKKQLQYANRRNVDHVVFIGTDEAREGVIKLKNMQTGQEQTIEKHQLMDALKQP